MGARQTIRLVAVAIVLSVVLVLATGVVRWDAWYAQHGFYRAQVDAFLSGRLALATVPDGMAIDLAWTPAGTQQVWGLGVPLWQAPFELIGRVFGVATVPDRIPLIAWIALAFVVAFRAFWKRAGEPAWLTGGTIVIVAMPPVLVTMMRGRFDVYEEAATYAYGAGAMLLAAIAGEPTRRRYLAIVVACGLAGTIRPTLWFYGLATAIVLTAVVVGTWWRERRSWREIAAVVAIAATLFVAGGAALYTTNAARFGDGFEFGHGLNVHPTGGNVYATRFEYPFAELPAGAAAHELVGALFDRPELATTRGFFRKGQHWGEQPVVRSREYYFTTYSWTLALLIGAGLVLSALVWRRGGDPLARRLGAWAVIAGVPLVVLYLRAPAISSRYLVDFAPAFGALIVVAWRVFAAALDRRGQRTLAIVAGVAAWTSFVVRARSSPSDPPANRAKAIAATHALSRPTERPRAWPFGREVAVDPTFADVAGFDVCSDETRDHRQCDDPAFAGDLLVRGERHHGDWTLEYLRVPADDEVCEEESKVCTADTIRARAIELEAVEFRPPSLYLDAFGWDLGTGMTAPVAILYARDPAYVELDLAGDRDHEIRVSIGGRALSRIGGASTTVGTRVRFGLPTPIEGAVTIFLGFGPPAGLDRPSSGIVLRAVRWSD